MKRFLKNVFAYPRRTYHNWVTKLAVRMMRNLDVHMIRAHWTRAERRRFWREFFYSRKMRGEVEDLLEEKDE